MNQIYRKKSFIVFRAGDGYIIHNTEKSFKKGHTHIKNVNTAKYIVSLAAKKILPKHLSDYLLVSLLRLANDDIYTAKIEEMRKNQQIRRAKMKTYIGTKVIEAKPMNRGDYNKYRGWEIPADENPTDKGYLVKYPDGYESWSPAKVFEEAYSAFDGKMNFGHAIELMKMGYKVARVGWNGKKQYIQLAYGISYKTPDGEIVNCEHEAIGNAAVAFVGTSGVQMGWLASQADMLADDWMVVDSNR